MGILTASEKNPSESLCLLAQTSPFEKGGLLTAAPPQLES
jgi:hypothetical protein